MTTANKFFNKLFEENEKAKYMYANHDFSNYDKQKLNFLDKLSLISKYKKYFKAILLKRKISDRDKVNYILSYKAALTYPEHIKFNITTEDYEKNFISMIYVIAGINFFGLLYFLIKKPADQSIFKEGVYSFLFSMICGYGFRKYHKISYSADLSEIYLALENRMNQFPEMKYIMNNPNYLTEETEDSEFGDKL